MNCSVFSHKENIFAWLWHPIGLVTLRLLLAGVFIYAGLQKVGHYAELARIVYGYRIIHPELVNLVAITLPWLELMLGVLLLLGMLRRSSALVACGLFVVFIIAEGLAMARGIDTPCGCFSVSAQSDHIGLSTLMRSSILAFLSGYLIKHPAHFAEIDSLLEQPYIEKPQCRQISQGR